VSTGQRAALAVSIFLALNSLLKNGPAIILLDDPVAHVDDLNTLSFFDYLREVAVRNKRQIFFATANDKLANLFRKKFDFLGEQFKEIELNRSLIRDEIEV
jgi:DNA repair protein SbcC/Rad50